MNKLCRINIYNKISSNHCKGNDILQWVYFNLKFSNPFNSVSIDDFNNFIKKLFLFRVNKSISTYLCLGEDFDLWIFKITTFTTIFYNSDFSELCNCIQRTLKMNIDDFNNVYK